MYCYTKRNFFKRVLWLPIILLKATDVETNISGNFSRIYNDLEL